MAKFIEINEGEENAYLLNLDAVKLIRPVEDGDACEVFIIGDPWVDDEGEPSGESVPHTIRISYPEMKKLLKLK